MIGRIFIYETLWDTRLTSFESPLRRQEQVIMQILFYNRSFFRKIKVIVAVIKYKKFKRSNITSYYTKCPAKHTQHVYAKSCNIVAQQRFAHVWSPCSNVLQDVGQCWVKFEIGQIFVATFLDVARCCTRLASSFCTTSDYMIYLCCKMLHCNFAWV